MREETQQPSRLEQAARQAVGRAAAEVAKKALIRIGALLGAKGAAIVAAVVAVIVLVILLIVLLVSVAGAAFQSSTAVWPVPVATDAAGNYQASGWTISSRYGWRDNPLGGVEFHDGIDLANSQGTCPFGYHCGIPSIFDGTVQYLGWDQSASGDPSKSGGGMMVIVANGQEDHQVLYAHLEPYRLYVQLQGTIRDAYGRYDSYSGYQPIGTGALQPDLSNGGIEMTCLNDMPNFIPTRSGPGTVIFMYDRPADCTTTVVWGERGDGWHGWVPDDPSGRAGDEQRADLRWQTSIEPGKAKDVALRFRAHLVPPPPPPTEVPSATTTLTPGDPTSEPVPQASSGQMPVGRGSVEAGDPGDWARTPTALPAGGNVLTAPLARTGKPRSCTTTAGGWIRCVWALADIPTERERFATAPDPWIVAAQAYTSTQVLDDQEDAEAAAVAPAQLLPAASASPLPARGLQTAQTATPTPAATPAQARTTRPRISVEALEMGGPEPGVLSQTTSAPLSAGTESGISVVPLLASQLLLHDPATNRPEHIGVSMTISDRVAEQVQITMRPEPPAILSSGDAETTIVDMPAGTLQNYAVPGFDFTVPPGTAPGVQVCVTLEWKGLTSAVTGSARACTVTADPGAVSSTTPPPPPGGPGDTGTPNCASLQLVRLPNVTAPNPQLVAPAAASFAEVRAEILGRTGIDALAVLADVLRQPSFTTTKPGVLDTSWHKAGRAVDLNQGGPFVRVAEGRRFRLYVNNVDITAIFEAHGWQRIPVQGDTLEWWHYEWHPDGIAWTSAMLQVWDLPTLKAAFPGIDWSAIGCAGGSNTGTHDPPLNPQESEQLCALGAPRYSGTVEILGGCGPPLHVGDKVYQLDSTLGFVGLSGRTTGPHLHMGLKVKSYNGSWPYMDICTPEWLDGRTPPPDAYCYTDMADPLAFLPRAPGNNSTEGDPTLPQASDLTPTSIIPEGAPYQLPPPNYPNSLVFTPIPDATPVGQYWSPYPDGGRYGGGGVGEWFCSLWSGWPWCN